MEKMTQISAGEFGITSIAVPSEIPTISAKGKCPMCGTEFDKLFTKSLGVFVAYACPCTYFTYHPFEDKVMVRPGHGLGQKPGKDGVYVQEALEEQWQHILRGRLPGLLAEQGGRHRCHGMLPRNFQSDSPSYGYGGEIVECFEDARGKLWIWVGMGREYCIGVNNCPYCGYQAPETHEPKLFLPNIIELC